MPITLDGTNGITTPTYGGADTSEYVVPVTQFKNRIINGAMVIDQRNAGASVTIPAYTNTYGLDRWFGYGQPNASKFSLSQGNTSGAAQAAGFNKCLVATSLSAYSISSSDIQFMGQRIEGFNTADLQWGTANAKTVTLSFWAFSSITGTWGGAIVDSVNAYNYPFSYTISSANTWEYKTVTITGATSGTWSSTNGIGMGVLFSIGTGSSFVATAGSWTSSANIFGATGQNSLLGTNGAVLSITGCQLEIGSIATSFDYRPYGTELALCQRYCIKYNAGDVYQRYGGGLNDTTTTNYSTLNLPVEMRTAPTLTTTGTASNYGVYHGNQTLTTCSAVPTITTVATSSKIVSFGSTVSGGLTAGSFGQSISTNNTTSYLLFSAEL